MSDLISAVATGVQVNLQRFERAAVQVTRAAGDLSSESPDHGSDDFAATMVGLSTAKFAAEASINILSMVGQTLDVIA